MKNSKPQEKNLYKCPICKDTGFIEHVDKEGYRSYSLCSCREKNKLEKMWANSGIKVSDLDKSFSNFEVWNDVSKKMKDISTSYYMNFLKIKDTKRNSIMLCGQPGAGKSHLSLALANNLIKNKHSKVVYMPYRDVITNLKQNMLDEVNYRKIVSKYKAADVLLIDDLFKGKVNESDINIMFEIVNHRYVNNLPMIISTEHYIESLLSFDEAIASRMYEMSKDYMVEIEKTKDNNFRMRWLGN